MQESPAGMGRRPAGELGVDEETTRVDPDAEGRGPGSGPDARIRDRSPGETPPRRTEASRVSDRPDRQRRSGARSGVRARDISVKGSGALDEKSRHRPGPQLVAGEEHLGPAGHGTSLVRVAGRRDAEPTRGSGESRRLGIDGTPRQLRIGQRHVQMATALDVGSAAAPEEAVVVILMVVIPMVMVVVVVMTTPVVTSPV